MKTIPCHNCITIGICVGIIRDHAKTNGNEVKKYISNDIYTIFEKCTLIKNFYYHEKHLIIPNLRELILSEGKKAIDG